METLPLNRVGNSDNRWSSNPVVDDDSERTGSVLSSSVNLAACAFGASMLSLPYAMFIAGPVVALVFLVLFGVLAFIAAQAILRAGIASGKSTYSSIVRHHFGDFQGSLTDILVSVALTVAAISYVVGLSELLPGLLKFTNELSRVERIICIVVALFPLTLISTLAAFGPASAFGCAGCYMIALALTVQVFMDPSWHFPPVSKWTTFHPVGFVSSLPMICFVYAFHYVLTDTISELKTPSAKRTTSVNAFAIVLLMGCYVPIAISGYLLESGKGISSNVLAGMGEGSVVVIIAKWTIAALLFVTYSLFIIPLRRKIEFLSFGRPSSSMLSLSRLVIAAGLNISVAIVSALLPGLGLANSVAGGCIALVMFFFPGRLIVRNQLDKPPASRQIFETVVGTVLIVLGILVCFVGLFGALIFDRD